MSAFRVTRALLRGQFASAACFEKWLEAHTDMGHVQLITLREDPGIPPGGVSDARYYLWRQDEPKLTFPEGCTPDMVNDGKTNEWPTQAQAQAVIDAKLGQASVIAEQVKKANEKAVSPANLAASVAADVKGAAEAVSKLPPWVPLLGAGLVIGGVGYAVLSLMKRR